MPRPLFEIQGFDVLRQRIERLANDRQKKAEITKILRRVAQGTVKVARRMAPISDKPHVVSGRRTKKTIQPGALRKSIGVFTSKRSGENALVYVGPRAKGNFDGWYGHFVEYGHNIYNKGARRMHSASERARNHNNSLSRGRTTAQPYMQETYSQTKGQVTAESEKAVAKYIQKSIDRLSI